MNRIALAAVALLASVAGAQADTVTGYRDQIRPHGHPRSDAIYQASLDFCYARTGADRNLEDTPAFKQCMLGRGYLWKFTRVVRSARPAVEAPKHGRLWWDQDSQMMREDTPN